MATIKLKVIKVKDFELANKEKHTHYTTAYKGRVFAVSTLRHEAETIVFDKKEMTLTITGDVEPLAETSVDVLTGEKVTYISIVPKMDMVLAAF